MAYSEPILAYVIYIFRYLLINGSSLVYIRAALRQTRVKSRASKRRTQALNAAHRRRRSMTCRQTLSKRSVALCKSTAHACLHACLVRNDKFRKCGRDKGIVGRFAGLTVSRVCERPVKRVRDSEARCVYTTYSRANQYLVF